MEVQLKELIEKIKNDGIKEAEASADKIIQEAEAKAEEIVEKAKKEASQIVEKAKEDAEKSEQSGREALKQAGRDLVLNLQTRITELFNVLVKDETAASMDEKLLAEAVLQLITSWKGDVSELEIILSKKDLAGVEKHLRAKLSSQIEKGLEIKASKTLDAGFLVSVKDGSAYHDFSAEGIAEVLSEYLNPRLSDLLNEGIKSKAEA